jgi:hypothetical protein
MYESKDNLPATIDQPGVKLQSIQWGEMIAGHAQFSKGVDFTPMLKGLPDDLCPCPHWGYILKGKMHVRYKDHHEEVIGPGQIYYLQPGHTVWIDEDIEFVEFSPVEENNTVMKHISGG